MIIYLITCYVIHMAMTQIQYLKTGAITIGQFMMLVLSPFTTPTALCLMFLGWCVDLNKRLF